MVSANPFTQAIQDIQARGSQGGRDPGYWYLEIGILSGMLCILYFHVYDCYQKGLCPHAFDFGPLVVTLCRLWTIYFLKSALFWGCKSLKVVILGIATPQVASRLDFIPENIYMACAGCIFALLMKEIFLTYYVFQQCIRTNIEECAIPFKLLGFVAETLCFGNKGSPCFTTVINAQFPVYALLAFWLDTWIENQLFGTTNTNGPPPPPVLPPGQGPPPPPAAPGAPAPAPASPLILTLPKQEFQNALNQAIQCSTMRNIQQFRRLTAQCPGCRNINLNNYRRQGP